MTIPLAYRNRLLAQFIESFVIFVFKKRTVAALLAKGELTPAEANLLSHYQRDIARDRAVFQLWKEGLQDHTKWGFPAGSYTLAQVKSFILANRAEISDLLAARHDAEIAEIEALKIQTEQAAVTEEDLANLPALLAELDVRISKRQMWKTLVLELKAMNDNDYATEGEL